MTVYQNSNRNAFPLFQNLWKEMEEKAAGHGGRYYVGYRFGKKCGICSEQSRQQNQSGKEDELPKGGAEECQLYFSKGSGLIYQRILYRQRDNHKSEPFNISDRTA